MYIYRSKNFWIFHSEKKIISVRDSYSYTHKLEELNAYLKSEFSRIWRITIQIFFIHNEESIFINGKRICSQLKYVKWFGILGTLQE